MNEALQTAMSETIFGLCSIERRATLTSPEWHSLGTVACANEGCPSQRPENQGFAKGI